ncbi:hypothetical protein ACSFA0_22540 [Variovorax sp. LT1P1]|uniref:hypothetical protein n=1 Tax=Variovorax sp. LT1P1 TaxID=3443730 RepID=UPI003F485A30
MQFFVRALPDATSKLFSMGSLASGSSRAPPGLLVERDRMGAEAYAPAPYEAAVEWLEKEAQNPDLAAAMLSKSVMLVTKAAGTSHFRTMSLGNALAASALVSPQPIERIERMALQGFNVDTPIRMARVFGGDAVWTLLHYGVAAGAPGFVACMLGLGADPTLRLPHAVDFHGRTRLISAFGLVANELHRRQDRDERTLAPAVEIRDMLASWRARRHVQQLLSNARAVEIHPAPRAAATLF